MWYANSWQVAVVHHVTGPLMSEPQFGFHYTYMPSGYYTCQNRVQTSFPYTNFQLSWRSYIQTYSIRSEASSSFGVHLHIMWCNVMIYRLQVAVLDIAISPCLSYTLAFIMRSTYLPCKYYSTYKSEDSSAVNAWLHDSAAEYEGLICSHDLLSTLWIRFDVYQIRRNFKFWCTSSDVIIYLYIISKLQWCIMSRVNGISVIHWHAWGHSATKRDRSKRHIYVKKNAAQ